MHTTVSQNKAHRSDVAWIKSNTKTRGYLSEYSNVFTGQMIRKSNMMTGRDWHVFNTEGEIVARAHSLTWAKMDAAA